MYGNGNTHDNAAANSNDFPFRSVQQATHFLHGIQILSLNGIQRTTNL
jgi:hypothetical protein